MTASVVSFPMGARTCKRCGVTHWSSGLSFTKQSECVFYLNINTGYIPPIFIYIVNDVVNVILFCFYFSCKIDVNVTFVFGFKTFRFAPDKKQAAGGHEIEMRLLFSTNADFIDVLLAND